VHPRGCSYEENLLYHHVDPSQYLLISSVEPVAWRVTASPRGSGKRKNRPGVENFFKATRARPTYLRNQAHFHIWKCDIRGIWHARQPVPAAISPPQMRVSPPHHDHQTPLKQVFMLVFGILKFSGSYGHDNDNAD